ncbi:MAG: ATP-binding protein [Vulcanimicrobiota bacterium]
MSIDATSRSKAFLVAAKLLQDQLDPLSRKVSDRCFAELESYKTGNIPREESVATVRRLTSFLVRALESGHSEHASEQGSTLHDEIITFDEGIAARRVKMAIQFEDLIRGLQFMRLEVWACLSRLSDHLHAQGVFMLEKRINEIFDAYFLGLSSSYRNSQSAMLAEQQKALDKWEEVVKSASEIRLKIPCLNEFAAIVRLQAEAIARRVNFSEEEVYDIITAVGEVCDNSIEHSHSEQGIDVEYTMNDREFRVEVRDYGTGFDPAGKGELPPDMFSEDGRGIFLMRNLMDRVEIDSKIGQGTRILMIKSRKR